MSSAIIYSVFGAIAGATGAFYVCAVHRFKRLERKCIKTCLPLVLYASVIFFLVCSFTQLLLLLPSGFEGILSLSLLVILGLVSYRKTLAKRLPSLFQESPQPMSVMLEHKDGARQRRTSSGGR